MQVFESMWKKKKKGKWKMERKWKMGERVDTPSWKENLEGIQVACYLFGEAYEKVKREEKRREEI